MLPRVRPRMSARAQASARRVVDDNKMRQHQRHHDHRRRPLQDVEADVHGCAPVIPASGVSPRAGTRDNARRLWVPDISLREIPG